MCCFVHCHDETGEGQTQTAATKFRGKFLNVIGYVTDPLVYNQRRADSASVPS